MIKNNKFFIKNIKNLVIFGYHENLKEIFDFTKKFKIKNFLISTKTQTQYNFKNCERINLNKLDDKFFKYCKNKININETIFLSLGSRYIFKKKIISFLNGNLINSHSSRLPLDKGGANVSWKIINNDRICNQTLHVIDEGIDTGPIITTKTSTIPKNCIIPYEINDYQKKDQTLFLKNFIIDLKEKKKFKLTDQQSYLGTYNPRLETIKDGLIDWGFQPLELINFINAFDKPYLGASTYITNKKFKKVFIRDVQLHGGETYSHPFMSGLIRRHHIDWIIVSTSSNYKLIIKEVNNEKGKNIIKDLKVGDRFYSRITELENTKSNRTVLK